MALKPQQPPQSSTLPPPPQKPAKVQSGSAKSRPSSTRTRDQAAQQDRKQVTGVATATTTTTAATVVAAANIALEDDDDAAAAIAAAADAAAAEQAKPGFRQKSEGELVIAEGSRLPLWCKLKSHFPVSWMKDKFPIFDDRMKKVENTPERFNFIGNLTDNDYSIELTNAQPADSGQYWCQIVPDQPVNKKPIKYNNNDLIAETNLTVMPTPTLTQPPITANSLTTADENGQEDHHTNHHSQYIGPLSQTSSSSPSDNNLVSSNNYLDSFPSPKSNVNHNKAREAVPTTAIKLSTGYMSAAPYNYNQHHHSTVRASTISTNSPGLLGGNGSGSGLHNAALIWPYLLLALAALLMLANIYLIFSLIKRHTRCSKEDEEEEHDEDDPSLA